MWASKNKTTKAAKWGNLTKGFQLSHPRPRFLPTGLLLLSKWGIFFLSLECKFSVTLKSLIWQIWVKQLFSATWGTVQFSEVQIFQVPTWWICVFELRKEHTCHCMAQPYLTIAFNPKGLTSGCGKTSLTGGWISSVSIYSFAFQFSTPFPAVTIERLCWSRLMLPEMVQGPSNSFHSSCQGAVRQWFLWSQVRFKAVTSKKRMCFTSH